METNSALMVKCEHLIQLTHHTQNLLCTKAWNICRIVQIWQPCFEIEKKVLSTKKKQNIKKHFKVILFVEQVNHHWIELRWPHWDTDVTQHLCDGTY